MVNKRFWLGILVMVLVFGMTVASCDLITEEEEKYGAETVNGVWYQITDFYGGEKTGTVITISNGVGILTAVGVGGDGEAYPKYVSRGLINIGDIVFRNIVYIGYDQGTEQHKWSYDIWYRDGDKISYMGDDGGTPDWRNDLTLLYNTDSDTLWAAYGTRIIIPFKK